MQAIPDTEKHTADRLAFTGSQQELLRAVDEFLAGGEQALIIRGPAGTGKTTMVSEICRRLQERRQPLMLMAPTGRAARILQGRTGLPASTIHRFLYHHEACRQYQVEGQQDTETYKMYFELRTNTDSANSVYLVDEASMLSDQDQEDEFFRHGSNRLLKDLIRYVNPDHNDHRRKLIFVGDPCQLPPVGSKTSPALCGATLHREYGLHCRVHELTEVVRQQGNSGILRHAGTLREAIQTGNYSRIQLTPLDPDVVHISLETLLETFHDKDILIAFSNARVRDLNRMLREHRVNHPPYPLPGERLVCVRNLYCGRHPLMNGDMAEVVRASPEVVTRVIPLNQPVDGRRKIVPVKLCFRRVTLAWHTDSGERVVEELLINETLLWSGAARPPSEENKALYIDFLKRHPDLKPGTAAFTAVLREDPWFHCAQMKFGYAVTGHKAQGGEWDRVFVDFEGRRNLNEETFRWIYTALTRARKQLGLISPPHVSAMCPLQPPPSITAELSSLPEARHMPSDLPSRISALLPPGTRLNTMHPHPYAWDLEIQTEETEPSIFRVRLCYNRRGVFTAVTLQPPSPHPLATRVASGLSALEGQVHRVEGPSVEIKGWPNEVQRCFLETLQQRLAGSAFQFCGGIVHTPYHLQLRVHCGAEEQRFDVWHRESGRLKGMVPSGSASSWAAAVCLQVLDAEVSA